MSGEGSRLDLELRDRVSKLEKHFAELAKWTHFNLRENIKGNKGAEGPVANVDGRTSEIVGRESTPGSVQNDGNQEGNVEKVYLVLVGDGNNYQQVRVDVIDKPHGNSVETPQLTLGSVEVTANRNLQGSDNPHGISSDETPHPQPNPDAVGVTAANDKQQDDVNDDRIDIPQGNSDETLPQNPNPEGGSSIELKDQLNEEGETSTAAGGGSVDVGADQGSKGEADIPPQIKTEAVEVFYMSIKEEDDSDLEDNSAIRGGSLAVKKRKRSLKKKTTTAESKSSSSGSTSLKSLASRSQTISKKKKEEKSLKCPHCPRTLSCKSQLALHARCHSTEKPFSCPHCPHATAWEESLKGHIRRKHPDVQQPLACKRGWSSWKNLRKRGLLHCYFCPYKTNSSLCLVLHVRKHTGEKPFSCPRCPFAAKQSASLEYHFYNHCK